MTSKRVAPFVAIALFVAPLSVRPEIIPESLEQSHVRVTEPRLRQLLALGLSSSPTFKALVERLDNSDVVVYLKSDPHGRSGVAGRLTFLSVVAGYRYVVVRLTPLPSAVQQLSMIGHELQHAVEVAERPEIVDRESMFREYMRFGYVNGASTSGVALDTRAALEVGGRITDELRDAPLVVPAPALP